MAPSSLRCPAPSCRSSFDSSVALTFHIRGEHPEGTDAYRDVLSQARAAEYREKRDEAEAAGHKVVLGMVRDFGCACGRGLQWHRDQAKALKGVA